MLDTYGLYVCQIWDICCVCACAMGGCVYVYIRGYAKILGLGLKVHVGPMCRIFIIHMSGIYVTYVI